jgi:hypothetical protein
MSAIADAISALLDVGKYLKSFCESAEAAVETLGNVADSLRSRREVAAAREVVAGLFEMVRLRIELSNAIRSYARAVAEQNGEVIEIRERDNVRHWAEGLDQDIRRFQYYKNDNSLRPDIVVMLMRLMDASKKLIQALRGDAAGVERLSPDDLFVVADKLDLIREALEAISMEVWSIEREIRSLSERRESEALKRAGVKNRPTAATYLDPAQLRALDIELRSIDTRTYEKELKLERAGKDLLSGIGKKKSSDSCDS